MTLELIDKQDNFELVSDKIAAILVSEITAQQTLATDAGKDPDLWKIRIYQERFNPWEQWLNTQTDESPLCNIWFDNMSADKSTSNPVSRQHYTARYNLDCYAIGISSDDSASDYAAAKNVHRCVRLIRNILMAGENTYLGLRGSVWGRWVPSITIFQPDTSTHTIQRVIGARVTFEVDFNEFSPQFAGELLEYITTTIYRAEDGEVLLRADYDYTV